MSIHIKALAAFALLTLLPFSTLAEGAERFSSAFTDESRLPKEAELDRGTLRRTFVNMRWYDTEQSGGMRVFRQNDQTSTDLRLWPFETAPMFYFGYSGISYDTTLPNGSPLYAEFILGTRKPLGPTGPFNKTYGVYATVFGGVGGYWHKYLFPAPGSEVGITRLPNSPSESGDVLFRAYLNVADSHSEVGLVTPIGIREDFFTTTTVTIEYLEGNVLHDSVTSETITYEYPGEITLWWSEEPPHSLNGITYILRPYPIGPMRITVTVDGYKSDVVAFDVVQGRVYTWEAVLLTTEENTILDQPFNNFPLPPPLEVLTIATERAITADVIPILFLEEPTNPNGDDLRDVADLVRLWLE